MKEKDIIGHLNRIWKALNALADKIIEVRIDMLHLQKEIYENRTKLNKREFG